MLYTHSLSLVGLASLACAYLANKPVRVSGSAPQNAGIPPEAFVSYSIEFSSFPESVGELSLVLKGCTTVQALTVCIRK